MIQKNFPYSNLAELTKLFSSISGDNLTLSATLIPSDERFVDFVRNGYGRIHPTESSPFLPAVISGLPIDLKAFTGLPPNVRHVLQYIGEKIKLCDELCINPFYALHLKDSRDDYAAFGTPEIKFLDPFTVDSDVFDYSPNANPDRFRYRSQPRNYAAISGIISEFLDKFRSPEFFGGRKWGKVVLENFKHHLVEPMRKSVASFVAEGYVISECSVSSKDSQSLKSSRWSDARAASYFYTHCGRLVINAPEDFDTSELEALLK